MKGLRDWQDGAIAILLLLALLQGLSLVWCNIERMDIAYTLKEQQDALNKNRSLLTKLGVEQENLLSPHRLRRQARQLGLAPAAPGQIRVLDELPQKSPRVEAPQ